MHEGSFRQRGKRKQRSLKRSVHRGNEARYRMLFERAADGIWLARRDGRFVDVNPAACALLGYSRGEHLKLSVGDIIQEGEESRLREVMDTLEQGGQATGIWKIRRADGAFLALELSHIFTPEGYWQAIGRDVTGKKRAGEALRAQSAAMRQQAQIFDATLSSISDFTYSFDPRSEERRVG